MNFMSLMKLKGFAALLKKKMGLAVVFFISTLCVIFMLSCARQSKNHNDSPYVDSVEIAKDSSEFFFLGKAIDREENFSDTTVVVTLDNVARLYREYDVCMSAVDNMLIVRPRKLYYNSYFFNRLLKFESGVQTASVTFYGYRIVDVIELDEGYILGLNSLPTTAGCNNSSFTCKTVLLDKTTLKVMKEREFRYKEQKDPYYAYAYLDTLYLNSNGTISFKVINTGFDPDDYFEYVGIIDQTNTVVSSSKKQVFIK